MPAGLPQGSVMSPILFDIFMYGIATDEFVQTLQFADDTSAYATNDNPRMVQCKLNAHHAKLHRYFGCWKLLLNVQKSVLCIFSGFVRETGVKIRRQFNKLRISLCEELLKPQKHVKLLGLTLQSNGRFCRHVDTILDKGMRSFPTNDSFKTNRSEDPDLHSQGIHLANLDIHGANMGQTGSTLITSNGKSSPL